MGPVCGPVKKITRSGLDNLALLHHQNEAWSTKQTFRRLTNSHAIPPLQDHVITHHHTRNTLRPLFPLQSFCLLATTLYHREDALILASAVNRFSKEPFPLRPQKKWLSKHCIQTARGYRPLPIIQHSRKVYA